jgi:hypothetical protein
VMSVLAIAPLMRIQDPTCRQLRAQAGEGLQQIGRAGLMRPMWITYRGTLPPVELPPSLGYAQ